MTKTIITLKIQFLASSGLETKMIEKTSNIPEDVLKVSKQLKDEVTVYFTRYFFVGVFG